MPLGPVSFSGLASGLDIKSIVSAILAVERRPADRLESRQAQIESRKSVFQDFSAKLSTLRGALQDLASPVNLGARSAAVSDASVLSASVGNSAAAGSHTIEVTALAKAHRVRSETLSSQYDSAVTDGTITIRSGSRDPIVLDVSAAAGTNTLVSVRDRINAADAGISASIVSDGAGDLLVVRSTATGASNALTISDTTNLGLGAPANVIDVAQSASLRVDGVTVTSESNTVSSAIAGVSLQLLSAKPGTTVDLTVAADTAKLKEALKKFVETYNAVAGALRSQFTADPETGRAGALSGDGLLRRAQDLLQSAVSGGVTGLSTTDLTTLGAVGIAIEGASGNLKIDDAKLNEALTDRYDQVARLLGVAGRTSDAAVAFAAASGAALAGTYDVKVTRAAERAVVTGSTAIAPGGIGSDETLTIGAGGVTVAVSLVTGDTPDKVVQKINAALTSSGIAARAALDGGRLRIASNEYGSSIALSVVSSVPDGNDGKSTGIGNTPIEARGEDVAGAIQGVAATGNGRVLTAADDSPAAGLSVSIFADASAVAARGGDFGTVTLTRGIADTLARDLKTVVDPVGGLIATIVSGLDEESRSIRDQIADIEERLRERETFLTLQFDRAERAIQSLQQQQAALGRSYSLS